MFEKYTDLAIESHEIAVESGISDGTEFKERFYKDVLISYSCAAGVQKMPQSRYFNLDIGKIWQMPASMRRIRAEAIASVISELLPQNDGCVLIAGIGNRDITPDSIGPLVADKVIVTRHLKLLGSELYDEIGFGEVSTIAPGVLGQTGIESGEIIKCIVKRIKPRAVIAIDALASRRLSRLCTNVQITDAGITPGSGVQNSRSEISQSTEGVPVIAIGMPTVVDAATLASDLFEQLLSSLGEKCHDCSDLLGAICSGDGKGLFVSPKESDIIIREASRLIADGINLALHKSIPYRDINEYRTQ